MRDFAVARRVYVSNSPHEFVTFATPNPSLPVQTNPAYVNALSILVLIISVFMFGLRNHREVSWRKNMMTKEAENKKIVKKHIDDEDDDELKLKETIGTMFKKLELDEFENKSWLHNIRFFATTRMRNLHQIDMLSLDGYYVALNIMGQVLNHVLIVVVIMSRYQADDGVCEGLLEMTACEDMLSLDFLNPMCTWHRVGQYCTFKDPSFDILYIIRFVAFVSVAVYPLNFILSSLLRTVDTMSISVLQEPHQSILKRRDRNKVYIDNGPVSDELKKDDSRMKSYMSMKDIIKKQLEEEAARVKEVKVQEHTERKPNVFREIQTKSSLLWSAARLHLLQHNSDLLIPSDEADYLVGLEHHDEICSLWQPIPKPMYDRTWQLFGMIEHELQMLALRFSQHGQPSIASRIVRSHSKALVESKLCSARREEGNPNLSQFNPELSQFNPKL